MLPPNMRISGPNAEGFYNEPQRIAATFSPTVDVRPDAPRLLASPRRVGIVAQSGGIGFAISAFSSERGRALSWSVGVIVVLYAANFLLPLWGPTKAAAQLSPFAWFNPAPLLQRGTVAWGDVCVLLLYAAIPLSVAAWQFARRDLAGG